MKLLKMLLKICLLLLISGVSHAQARWFDYDDLYFQVGAYTHFRENPEFKGRNLMFGLEAIKSKGVDDKVFGILLFDNSFGQASQYAYIGKKWNFSGRLNHFHARLTAGILHGYKEPYDNKLPLTTKNGWSPGILPSIGYQKGRFGFDLKLLGYEGIMFATGFTF